MKKIKLMLIYLFLFMYSMKIALADLVPDVVTKSIEWLFVGTKEVYIYRFILWILVFAIFYFGAEFLFKEKKNITIAVAAVLALICSMLIPEGLLLAVFELYGTFTGLLLFAIPSATILFIASKLPKTPFGFAGHAIIFALTAYFFGILLKSISQDKTTIFESALSLQDIAQFCIFIFFVLAVWNLIKAFTHGASASVAEADAFDDIASKIARPGDALKSMFPRTSEIIQEKKEDKFQKNVADKLSQITAEGEYDSKQILNDLETIKKIKNKYGSDPEVRQEIARAIQDITNREHRIKTVLDGLKGLLHTDWIVNRDELKRKIAQFKKIEGEKGELGKSPEFKEIETLAKIDEKEELTERRDLKLLAQLDFQEEDHSIKFKEFLREALELIRQGKIREADLPLNRAIAEEKTRDVLFKKMQRYEKILRRLEKMEIKIEKKEEKDIHRDESI